MGYHLPTLERDDRKELLTRVEAGATGGVDFYVMLLLSSGLASLGLLEDSTAVVIGAMLVAPLMGPFIGAGLGLAQGNFPLFRISVTVALIGLLVGFAVSVAIDGTVTRIQMRATTITNWDRKEFVVPNKQFITGTLMNWTLSNDINRIAVITDLHTAIDERFKKAGIEIAFPQHDLHLRSSEAVIKVDGT